MLKSVIRKVPNSEVEMWCNYKGARWLIAPHTAIESKLKPLMIGPDAFDYSMFVVDGNGHTRLVLPYVNTDPSNAKRWDVRASEKSTLASGLYQWTAGYHLWGTALQSQGFILTRLDGGIQKWKSWNEAYYSPLRVNLPDQSGRNVASYINVHKSSSQDDASLGCFTIPADQFVRFREPFKLLDCGLLLFFREPDAEALAMFAI